MMKVAIPDLISPSYLLPVAAVELGFLDAEPFELLYPVTKTYEELRDGWLDFVGGAAHAAPTCLQGLARRAAPGARSLQHMYWFRRAQRSFAQTRPPPRARPSIGAAPGPSTA